MSRLLVAQRALTVPGWAKDALWRKAQAIPSLDLRFADNKSLVDATTGSSLVTFTRASSGTFVGSDGVLQTAVTDAPRFDHNPTTGESLGLLVEEQRTNSLLRSEEFDNASWNSVTGAMTVTANSIAAPDGLSTADTVAADGTSASHFVSQSLTLSAVPYAYSVFAKAGTNNFLQLRLFNGFGGMWANFNLATGVVGTVGVASGAAPTSSIQAYPNGWYRCTMAFTPAATTSSVAGYIVDSASAFGGAPNSLTTTVHIWGAQLETGAFPTSYIPTTTAAVTRSADVASITGANFSSWYRQDEGTVFCDAKEYPFTSTASRAFYGLVNSSDIFNNFVRQWIWNGSTGFVSNSIYTSVSGPIAANLSKAITNENKRIAVGIAANNFARAYNGTDLATDTAGNMPSGIDAVWIGSTSSAILLSGHVRRLTYWPQRLSNSTLQSITQ